MSWLIGALLAALGLVLWVLSQWRQAAQWLAGPGRLLVLVGTALAVWRAILGEVSLGLLLLLGLAAAAAVWLTGRALGVATIASGGRAWTWPLLLVFVVRNFGWEPYRIPSGSMRPTLVAGDYVLINRHAYGLNVQPLGWEPWGFGAPQRGDIVVFRHPDSGEVLIKRILGLPGDRIDIVDGAVQVNGVPNQYLEAPAPEGFSGYEEVVDGRSYQVQHRLDPMRAGYRDGFWQVGENSYFVLGDNRDNSLDSRVWGTFERSRLLGRAERVWMTWPGGQPPSLRWHSLEPD